MPAASPNLRIAKNEPPVIAPPISTISGYTSGGTVGPFLVALVDRPLLAALAVESKTCVPRIVTGKNDPGPYKVNRMSNRPSDAKLSDDNTTWTLESLHSLVGRGAGRALELGGGAVASMGGVVRHGSEAASRLMT